MVVSNIKIYRKNKDVVNSSTRLSENDYKDFILKDSYYQTIMIIDNFSFCSNKKISDITGLTYSYVYKIVNRLLCMDLIYKLKEGRENSITFTTKGLAVLKLVKDLKDEIERPKEEYE